MPLPDLLQLLPAPAPFLLHAGAEGHGHVNIWLLVGLGIVGNAVYFAVAGPGMLAGRALRSTLEEITGGSVEVGEIRLPLREGTMTFENLRVMPADGEDDVPLMEIERGEAAVTATDLAGRAIDVAHLRLSGLRLDGPRLRRTLDAASADIPPAGSEAAEGSQPIERGRRLRIGRVSISDIAFPGPNEIPAVPGQEPIELGAVPAAAGTRLPLNRAVEELIGLVLGVSATLPDPHGMGGQG